MGKIQKLPESLIRLIAAGEVVERPASVLKELLENSLDAGAKRIHVDLWGAGRQRIRVSDDGHGMTPEDAQAALERHATSKLKTFDDLYALATFGFRGEALPSIAAVSRLELCTRTPDADTGWRIALEGGRVVTSQAAGHPAGTTIDVQDLFFNTPARAKFLKRDSTERSHLLKVIQEIALAHPTVGFEATVDGKEALSLAQARDLKSRLFDLWGASLAERVVPMDVAIGPVKVRGYVNDIPAHHPTKSFQILFVNQRPVQQRMLVHAIYEAYHEWLPVGRHPVFALFIDIEPALVDVNAHPTKREVRFSDERAVYDVLFSKIRELFKKNSSIPVVSEPPFLKNHLYPQRVAMPSAVESQVALFAQAPSPVEDFIVADRAQYSEPLTSALSHEARGRLNPESLRIIGQFNRLYLLVEQEDELLLIDQHAAAERVLYEKFLNSKEGVERQRLLEPYLWHLTPAQAQVVDAALPDLEQLGFGLEAFGGGAFALKEWPAALPELKHAKKFLDLLIESLQQETANGEEHARHERVAMAACRAAIKANDPLASEEMRHLLKELSACQRPMTCPHGRPTHIRLPLAELHRRFKRT